MAELERKPRVTIIEGSYFRKGRCARCGKSGVERSKTFTGMSMAALDKQAERWNQSPLYHKRCELFAP